MRDISKWLFAIAIILLGGSALRAAGGYSYSITIIEIGALTAIAAILLELKK